MRIVYWNIRAGGGRRRDWIAAQIERWQPDVVGLSEFRDTAASRCLAGALGEQGLHHQLRRVRSREPAVNGVFLAARTVLTPISLRRTPPERERWLLARVAAGTAVNRVTAPVVGVLHAPNYVTGRKRPFFDAVTAFACRWRGGPALIGGDTNCGVPPLDGNPAAFHPWETAWIPGLEAAGWMDVYRQHHPARPTYSWYSPNAGNGYRLDQVFAHRSCAGAVHAVQYAWGTHPGAPSRRDALSDHAALIVDMH